MRNYTKAEKLNVSMTVQVTTLSPVKRFRWNAVTILLKGSKNVTATLSHVKMLMKNMNQELRSATRPATDGTHHFVRNIPVSAEIIKLTAKKPVTEE